MIHRESGFLLTSKARELLFKRLLGLFSFVFVLFSLQAEVDLKGVSVEPGSPGKWTVARVRVQNSGGSAKKAELKLTLGSLENSVFEQTIDVNLPKRSVRMIWVPIWIPEDILKGAKVVNKNSKQRNFFDLLIQLYENGALKHRETALGTMDDASLKRGMNYGRNRDKNALYDPLAEYLPKEAAVLPDSISWGKNRYTFKQRSDEIQGFSHLHPDIYERKSIIWVKKGFDQTHGLFTLLNWVERGGLLIIDPMAQEELGNLGSILGIETGEDTWNSLKKPDWKLDGKLVLKGNLHYLTSDWQPLMAERGVQIASERKWGLGKAVILNYDWNGLIGKDRERAKKILDNLIPKTMATEFEATNWKSSSQNNLVMKHGNKIWSKQSVMMFLGSLIAVSLILWFLPYLKTRQEIRWGIWSLAMLGWTGVALGLYLSKASSGSKFSSAMISYGKAGGFSEKTQGFSVFYSESLRKFPIDYVDGVDCFKKTNSKSTVMSRQLGTITYEDFSLQPMRVNLFEWSKTSSKAQPKVKLNWGDKLNLEMPDELKGKDLALVVGRKIWEFKGEAKVGLELETGKIISKNQEGSELLKTAYSLSTEREGKRSSFSSDRYWLLWNEKGAAPFTIPNDIEKNELLTRLLELELNFKKGPLSVQSGMTNWFFKRGKGVKSWKSSDLGFDGLSFKTEAVNMSLGWRFELPAPIKSRVKVDQLVLNVATPPETVKANSLYVIVKGKRQRLTISHNKVKLPKEALQNGAVEIEVQPPLPSPGSGTMMRPAWRPWVEGLELKGSLH